MSSCFIAPLYLGSCQALLCSSGFLFLNVSGIGGDEIALRHILLTFVR